MVSFREQRLSLLDKVRRLPPGPRALETLAKVRRDFDSAIDEYKNSLNILSDTTYQDRKHFLLELIQNADDAQFVSEQAVLKFVINNDSLELLYNEKGFQVEDVIAITGTGSSTKGKSKQLAKGFIGEKGIGFKSVFALASHVEIESPPWHFVLHKESCIIPEPVQEGTLKRGDGTRIKVNFIDPATVGVIADELYKFVDGQMESFLFLQRLSQFVVEDRRIRPWQQRTLTTVPADRCGDMVTLKFFPENRQRGYMIYDEDLEFPAELVEQRWDKLGINTSLKRKVTVAFPTDVNRRVEGRLFCFLPTEVKLPVPLFLQVDGHTKADRERLHDPINNGWNRYLLSALPQILLRAILDLRKRISLAPNLPDYVPTQEGTDQLAHVFRSVASELKTKPWIYTFDGNWVSPAQAIRANGFWTKWFTAYPSLRQEAEQVLGKSFMHPSWSSNSTWKEKWDFYDIPFINELQIATVLNKVTIPDEMLCEDENLIELYQLLGQLPSLISRWDRPNTQKIKYLLSRSAIYPLEGGQFGPLKCNQDNKIFFVTSRSKRATGLEGRFDCRIINTEYTFRFDPGGDATEDRIAEGKRINERNRLVRDLLTMLGVEELNDKALLEQVQIPWLADSGRCNENDLDTRYSVLTAIFQAYRAKQSIDEDYRSQLAKMAEALFPSEAGPKLKLSEMLLPKSLRLRPGDNLYASSGMDVLKLPLELIDPPVTDSRNVSIEREVERRQKLREDWRQFLILCGIKGTPGFSFKSTKYPSPGQFRDNEPRRYRLWRERIEDDYTTGNSVEIRVALLDEATKKVLASGDYDHKLMAKALYDIWTKSFGNYLDGLNILYYRHLPPAGYFQARYRRFDNRSPVVKDIRWGGVNRGVIPLETANGGTTTADQALRVSLAQKYQLPTANQLLPVVIESNANEGYSAAYLTSLEVKSPRISDINQLWGKLPKEQYTKIIRAVVEFLRTGMSGEGLQIYDSKEERVRPAHDFKLGTKGGPGVPLIEEQYPELGRQLGELLGLQSEGEAISYRGFFGKALQQGKAQAEAEEASKELTRLLKNWNEWNAASRGEIAQELQEALLENNLDYPPVVVINDPKTSKVLQEAGIFTFSLSVHPTDRLLLENAVRELGLSLPQEFGSISLSEQQQLDNSERQRFTQIAQGYLENLEPEELPRLQAKMATFGMSTLETWGERIYKVKSAARSIKLKDKEVSLPLKLPYLDKESRGLFVAADCKTGVALAHILGQLEFTRAKDALRDIKDIERKLKAVEAENEDTIPPEDIAAIPKPKGVSTVEVAQQIIDSLKDTRQAPEQESDTKAWQVGVAPDEEETIRKAMKQEIDEVLKAGPELHEKKVRTRVKKEGKALPDNIKLVSKNAIDPKTFLQAEYDGRCQACGTELHLSNGKKWFEVFRIVETNGEVWWSDQPFNILSFCPNCHALAKHGGGRDFTSIYQLAKELIEGNALPEEVPEHHGDYYVATVKINGKDSKLVMSKVHLNQVAALFEHAEEIAATIEIPDLD